MGWVASEMTQPPRPWVAPTRDDRVATTLSEGLGGPLGRHAGRHSWWTPVRVLLAITALCFAVGMVQKTPCATDTWNNGNERYANMCYSDIPYVYQAQGLAERAWPYSTDATIRGRYPVLDYPVGVAYYAWVSAEVTQLASGSPDLAQRAATPVDELWSLPGMTAETRRFVVVSVLGLGAATLAATFFLAKVNTRRPWDALAFAASPALALAGLVNWELLAVVWVAAALWAWTRDRTLLAGVFVGLGAAVKLYPVVLLAACGILAVRAGRWRDLGALIGGALAAWLAVNLPAMITGRQQWMTFWTVGISRGIDLGSPWLIVQQVFGTDWGQSTLNVTIGIAVVVWSLAVMALAWFAPLPPRPAQLAFLLVAGFLLVNKAYSPQYVLWLLPLAVLARPRLRDQVIWQSGEVLYFAAVWWYLGGYLAPPAETDGTPFYWLAIVLRMLGEIYLMAVVIRDIRRPARDPVRDPAWRRQRTTMLSNVVAV